MNKFGIPMVKSNSLFEWFIIQAMAWITNYNFAIQGLCDMLLGSIAGSYRSLSSPLGTMDT